jgi:FkbM family methyltransferase
MVTLKTPWSLRMYWKYGVHLSLRSFLRLRSALIAERSGAIGVKDTVSLRLRGPGRMDIRLRPVSNDLYTFIEVFVEQTYGGLLELVREAKTIIDLGANIGLSSVYLASRYPGCRVLAVEPDRANFDLLTANLGHLITAGVAKALRGAYWPEDGPVVFAHPAQEGHVNQGTVRGAGENIADASTAQSVQGYTLPTLIRESGFDQVDILKVDIEGSELGMFTGDLDWLKKVRCLAIEFHGRSREESGFDQVMKKYRFRVTEPNPHTILAVRADI